MRAVKVPREQCVLLFRGKYTGRAAAPAPRAELISGRMAAARLGCRHNSGGNDAATYLFPSDDAAVDVMAEVTGLAESWWTVTTTSRPVCNRGGAW